MQRTGNSEHAVSSVDAEIIGSIDTGQQVYVQKGRKLAYKLGDHNVHVFKDPMSATTHFVALWVALVGAGYLVFQSTADTLKLISMIVFSVGMVMVFASSSFYHFFDIGRGGNKWLQRIDHAAIFMMIAGTAVPPVVHYLDGPLRAWLLGAVAAIALAGIVFKIVWIECPDWLGASIYVVFGALIAVGVRDMYAVIDTGRVALLLGGVLVYFGGAFIFVFKKPDPFPDFFGHHEIWHLCVIVGAALHFVFMVTLIDVPAPPM